MRKPKVRLIKGTRDKGCALACLAMVLNKSEEEVDKDFEVDFNRSGIKPDIIKAYLADCDVSVIEKRVSSSKDRKKHNKRMLTPFADSHIVIAQQRVDAKDNHAVVMTKSGEILDPAIEPYKDYYYVVNVIGIFWD